MKKLLNQTTSLLALLILAGVIGVFVFSLRNRTEALPNQELGQSSYPGPNANDPDTQLVDPYPAPANPAYSQPISCNETYEWINYTNSEVGYTLNYPKSFRSGEVPTASGYKNFFIFLENGCFQCSHGVVRMDIRILENPDKLPIKEFVEQQFVNNSITRGESAEWIETFDILENGGEYTSVADIQAIRIQDTNRLTEQVQRIGTANPMVFVPHPGWVIEFSIGPNDPEPPFNPCGETLEMFEQILTTLQLVNPGQ